MESVHSKISGRAGSRPRGRQRHEVSQKKDTKNSLIEIGKNTPTMP